MGVRLVEYGALRFEIFNPGEKEVRITVRIDDRENDPDYADRYNQSFLLKPGMNHMEIQLDTLTTSGTYRKLNLRRIYELLIFTVNSHRKIVLVVDYVRLVA